MSLRGFGKYRSHEPPSLTDLILVRKPVSDISAYIPPVLDTPAWHVALRAPFFQDEPFVHRFFVRLPGTPLAALHTLHVYVERIIV